MIGPIEYTTFVRQYKHLLPTGRAWGLLKGTNFYKFIYGRSVSIFDQWINTVLILSSIIPDNNFFIDVDCDKWEQILGLSKTGKNLAQRKAAIYQKMAYPNFGKYRLNHKYLEKQLQNAGFNVFIHENRILNTSTGLYETIDPSTYGFDHSIEHGESEHGESEHGELFNNSIIANYVDPIKDQNFDYGLTWKHVFFIGGASFGTNADVPALRRDEFRKLILKLKPLHCIGITLINYT